MPQASVENLALITRKCTRDKSQSCVLRSHAYILTCGLEAHTSLANFLVSMMVEVGISHDHSEFWNILASRKQLLRFLIAGYIKSGESRHALALYHKVREDLLYPDGSVLVNLLRVCACLKDVKSGLEIHVDVGRNGLVNADPFIGSALLDMYAKCGLLGKAKEVFDGTAVRDVVMWTALLAGYAQFNHGKEALECLDQMQVEGVSPNAATFVCSLKACGTLGALDKGIYIHAHIQTKSVLRSNLIVGNALVDMYAKCGKLDKAQEAFDMIPVRDVISWNALIGGYTEHNCAKDALVLFKQMQYSGVSPNPITFACSLKACGSIRDKSMGQAIHLDIERKGLKTIQLVCTALVDMYAKCDMLIRAREVFDKCLIHDIVAWNTLISSYVEHDCGEEALNCLKLMQQETVFPNSVTFFCCLRACVNIVDLCTGREIHAEIARKGLLETNTFISNALIDMYARCGMLCNAQEVFDELKVHDVVSWNVLIEGYMEFEWSDDALHCFEQMLLEEVLPDTFTFTCSLKACGNLGAIDKGASLHAEIARRGLLERDPALGTVMIDLYAKCSLLSRAEEMFHKLLARDLVTWTTLMAAYVQHKRGKEALNSLKDMQREGFYPDAIAFTCSLNACGILGALDEGREIHEEIARKGFLEDDTVLSLALVDMYGKCGLLVKAQELFDFHQCHDVGLWNVLIAGYVKHEYCENALCCFKQMQFHGVSPDGVTYACVLKACGSTGAQNKGSHIHFNIIREGWLESDLIVGTALIDMYAKCGLLAEAQVVFDKLMIHDTTSWNSLIAGYAQSGELDFVIATFDKMKGEGKMPDVTTFLSVLNACSHAGMVDEGHAYFEAIRVGYGLTPTLEHLTCMIDLLGRAGQLNKVAVLVEEIPSHPNIFLWLTVMGACQKWDNAELGIYAFNQIMQFDGKEVSAYVSMGNIYALQDDAFLKGSGKMRKRKDQ